MYSAQEHEKNMIDLDTLDNLGKQLNLTLGLSFWRLISDSSTWGFDNQGYATTQAIDSFLKHFGNLFSELGVYINSTKGLIILE